MAVAPHAVKLQGITIKNIVKYYSGNSRVHLAMGSPTCTNHVHRKIEANDL
ncbi:Uncharacterised protein [uncultured archaeon]|nr:Uncharacterised protein [uncultured archaeon]